MNRTYIKINQQALKNNILQMKKLVGEKTSIMAVIKADAYGHGSVPIAKELEKENLVCGFSVATFEEAMELVAEKIKLPILILGNTFRGNEQEIILHNIRATIFNFDIVKKLSDEAVKLNKVANIHIKIDTGMNRIGLMPIKENIEFIRRVKELPNINIEGIFTHFATADELDKEKSYQQLKKFLDFIEEVENTLGLIIKYKHSANSAATLALVEARLDLVRVGISMYGIYPSLALELEHSNGIKLEPVLSWHSEIILIKEIEKGEEVSYGATFRAKAKMKIATIPIGYADGYPRSLSNQGYVLIKDEKCPIVGRICMDQFMVDITHLDSVNEGDEVVLIGKTKEQEITIMELGQLTDRFHYEILTLLSKRVPRMYQ